MGYIFETNVQFEMQGTLKVGLVKYQEIRRMCERFPTVGFF